jgi:hypothetical protein
MPSPVAPPMMMAPVAPTPVAPLAVQRPDSTPDYRHPSSIAPFALDVAPPPRRSILESTSEIQRAAGIPQRPLWQMAVGVAGAAVLSALVMGSVALGMPGSHAKKDDVTLAAASTPTTTTKTRVADFEIDSRSSEPSAAVVAPTATQDNTRAQEDSPAPVVTQIGQNEDAPPPQPAAVVAPAPKPVVVAPQSRPAAPVVAAAPKAASAPVSAPAKSAAKPSASQTGELHVPGGVNGVLVDGTPRRVTGGVVVLACGKHKVKAPMQSPRTVNVPCGGSSSL